MSFLLPPVNNNAQINHHFDTDDGTVRQLLANLDVDDESINGAELKKRINELLRIKGSVQKELMSLEKRRSEMQKQMTALEKEIEDVKKEATNHKTQLEKEKLNLNQAKAAQIELAERNTPELRPPLR